MKYALVLLIWLLIGCIHTVEGQQKDKVYTKATYKISDRFFGFYVGDWTGEGSFANGAKISARVTFKWGLDSAWLVCEHQDVPPGKFKALSMWGADLHTGTLVDYLFDNFQGHRTFTGKGPDRNGKVVWTSGGSNGGSQAAFFEHFIYEKLPDNRFKMTYEVSKDSLNWQLGDSLVFTRQ